MFDTYYYFRLFRNLLNSRGYAKMKRNRSIIRSIYQFYRSVREHNVFGGAGIWKGVWQVKLVRDHQNYFFGHIPLRIWTVRGDLLKIFRDGPVGKWFTSKNFYVGKFHFPPNLIPDGFAMLSPFMSKLYHNLKDGLFKDWIFDPSRRVLAGRAWGDVRGHFLTFLVGQKWTGELHATVYKFIGVTENGHRKACKFLDELDTVPNFGPLDLTDKGLMQGSANLLASDGFIGNLLGYKLRDHTKPTSKAVWLPYAFHSASKILKRLRGLSKDNWLCVKEFVICGGREKLLKLIGGDWSFTPSITRLVQIPTSTMILLVTPVCQAYVNVVRTAEGSGYHYADVTSEAKAFERCNQLFKNKKIIEGDVKNHDACVKLWEVCLAWAHIASKSDHSLISIKLIFLCLSSFAYYYIFLPTGLVFEMEGAVQTGNRATSIVNSIICRYRICYIFANHPYFVSQNITPKDVMVWNSGDDLLIGFKKDIKFSLKEFARCYFEYFGAELHDLKVCCLDPVVTPENSQDYPVYLGETYYPDLTLDIPVARLWANLCGKSNQWLKGKASTVNNFLSLVKAGSIGNRFLLKYLDWYSCIFDFHRSSHYGRELAYFDGTRFKKSKARDNPYVDFYRKYEAFSSFMNFWEGPRDYNAYEAVHHVALRNWLKKVQRSLDVNVNYTAGHVALSVFNLDVVRNGTLAKCYEGIDGMRFQSFRFKVRGRLGLAVKPSK